MKIYITAEGDSSVGLNPVQVVIEYPCLEDILEEAPEYRKQLREELRKFWHEELDNGYTTVLFEDECVDCGKIMDKKKKGKGYKKCYCMANQP